MAGMEDVVASIQVVTEQNKAMQMRVEQAEQEVIRQRGAIEQSAHVVASVSMGQVDSMSQTVQVMGKQVLEEAGRVNKSLLFKNNEQDFAEWQREAANYLNSTMEGLGMVMDCAVEEEEVLDWKIFKESHLGQYDIELEEMNERVYYWLVDHTEGESFDLVRSAGNGYGLEAWRKLNRRWGSSATGSSDRDLQESGKCRLEYLVKAIERLEKHIKDDEKEMTRLKQLLPKEVERQLKKERASLLSYSLLLADIMKQTGEEQTVTAKPVSEVVKPQKKLGSKTKEQLLVSGEIAVEPVHFYQKPGGGKGKQQVNRPGKSKGKGNEQKGKGQGSNSKGKSKCDEMMSGKGAVDMKKIQCHLCKKFGHYARDCWTGGEGRVKYQPNCMRCDSLTGPHYRDQYCSACGAQWPEHLWGPRCQVASITGPKGDGGKGTSSKGKGKSMSSNQEADTHSISQAGANRLDLGCLDQRLESINSVMTIGPGGRPIHDSLWVSKAMEKVATDENMVSGMKIAYLPRFEIDPKDSSKLYINGRLAVNRQLINEDKGEKRNQKQEDFVKWSSDMKEYMGTMREAQGGCTTTSANRKQSLKSVATVAMSSLTGAQAMQGNGVWLSEQVIGTRVQKMMVCMILTVIIVLLVSRWLQKTQWKATRRAAETLRRMLREQIDSGELDPAEAERIEYYHSSSVREAALMSQYAASSNRVNSYEQGVDIARRSRSYWQAEQADARNRLYAHDDDVDGWSWSDEAERRAEPEVSSSDTSSASGSDDYIRERITAYPVASAMRRRRQLTESQEPEPEIDATAGRSRCPCADCCNGVPPRGHSNTPTDAYVTRLHADFLARAR